jgi:hypothetical protein
VLADRRTISKHDLIESDQVMSDKVNKTAYVYHRSDQKWYWLSHQSQDEVVLFPTWTLRTEAEHAGVARKCSYFFHADAILDFSPHAAAFLYEPDKSAQPRESVEVRMIVFI